MNFSVILKRHGRNAVSDLYIYRGVNDGHVMKLEMSSDHVNRLGNPESVVVLITPQSKITSEPAR